MAKQTIGIGATANDGTGTVRDLVLGIIQVPVASGAGLKIIGG